MDINNVYIANIWMLIDSKLIGDIWDGDIKTTTQYVKTTIVYQRKENWYDLYTNQKYDTEIHGLKPIGTKFINFKKGLIPIRNVINFEKENMPKRKIKQLIKNKQQSENINK